MARRVVLPVAFAAAAMVIGLPTGDFLYAQTAGEGRAFEVASIKPAAIPAGREGGNRFRIEHTPDRLTMLNVTLSQCVQWAYGVSFFQVSAAHEGSESYDILARSGAPVAVSQMKLMLRDLLAKRFHLAVHRESRMLPVYELVVAKGGPKLPAANAHAEGPPVRATESLPRVQNDSFVFADASMAEFAQMLAQFHGIDLPVVDHTSIPGNFDLALKSGPSLIREGDTAGFLALLPAQLGLKLAAAKAPIEVIVIDHADRPTEN